MILTFKEQFVPKIVDGTKKTTFRTDKTRRWKRGMKIHFWKDNPRNVKNNPYQFAIGEVTIVCKAEINPIENYVSIDGAKFYGPMDLKYFAQTDGFRNWEEMKEFFLEPWEGVVIYWRGVEVGI